MTGFGMTGYGMRSRVRSGMTGGEMPGQARHDGRPVMTGRILSGGEEFGGELLDGFVEVW